MTVPAHQQKVTHTYVVAYPAHEPRAHDPHHGDFEEWKRRRRDAGTWWCDFAHDHRGGDTSECDLSGPLEAHHAHIEFAMANEADLTLLEAAYPGISGEGVGKWIDTDPNLTLLCRRHHRGHQGVHVASAADWSAEAYVRDLIS